jgi:hypothetical protein
MHFGTSAEKRRRRRIHRMHLRDLFDAELRIKVVNNASIGVVPPPKRAFKQPESLFTPADRRR